MSKTRAAMIRVLTLGWFAAAITLLGIPATPAVAQSTSAASVSAGAATTCARLRDGAVNCWGEGAAGRRDEGSVSAKPVGVGTIAGATAIDSHGWVTCAVTGGTVRCWRHGRYTSDPFIDSAAPLQVPDLSGAVAVGVGEAHACAVLADGRVACWDAFRSDSSVPAMIDGISTAVAVDAGRSFTCAVLAGGTVACWGYGSSGQLGDGRGDYYSGSPVTVSGISTAIAVSAGDDHACALLSGGGVVCWGAGAYGELGDGASTYSYAPVSVSGIGDAVAISSGSHHTCAVLADGGVRCWGTGAAGELGTGASSPTPVTNDVRGAVGIAAGYSHTCAVLASGDVQCWGAGESGQLGDGRSVSSATPVTVVGLGAAPPPVLEQSTLVGRVSGTVRVKLPGATRFTRLTEQSTLPLGTTIDTTAGKVRLTAAVDSAGTTESGLFDGGEFRTGQNAAGLTDLTLTGPLPTGCGARAAAASSKQKKKAKKKVRRLWGDAKGSFRSSGRHAAATVQGTKWLVEDRCEGTLVRVAQGVVSVEDLVARKTIRLTAGREYLARRGAQRQTARGFVTSVERMLVRLGDGRKRLATAIGGALDCSSRPAAARRSVESVIANRTTIRAELGRLRPSTARAKTVHARLQTAVTHSIAADRHYRDWLAGLERAGAPCPPPRSGHFSAAGRDDARASAAKRRFVAAFNPLARGQRLRTWRADQF